jgi:CubicO group peptidase (beta-lactamase class C family)
MDYRRDYTEDELAQMAFGLTPEFPPGCRWNYSNTGYVLLGIIIHKASGKFYGDVLRERVFTPLGMSTARVISEEDIIPNRAAGYRRARGELKNQEWVAPKLNTTADGSLYLSLKDYIAWDRGLRTKKVLKPESWATINTPVTLTSGKRYPYGFGWSIDTVAGQLRIHHGGAWQGFQTYISRYHRRRHDRRRPVESRRVAARRDRRWDCCRVEPGPRGQAAHADRGHRAGRAAAAGGGARGHARRQAVA